MGRSSGFILICFPQYSVIYVDFEVTIYIDLRGAQIIYKKEIYKIYFIVWSWSLHVFSESNSTLIKKYVLQNIMIILHCVVYVCISSLYLWIFQAFLLISRSCVPTFQDLAMFLIYYGMLWCLLRLPLRRGNCGVCLLFMGGNNSNGEENSHIK